MPWATKRFWIFDLDGTLTVAAHDFDAIRSELGLAPRVPILEQLEDMEVGAAAPLRARLQTIEEEIARRARPAAGARELLDHLRPRARLGILTRNTRAHALLTLAACGLDPYFEVADIVGRAEAAPKPSPEGIERLLRAWRAPAAEAVMVGDFRFDLEAGRAAGVSTIHVLDGGEPGWPALADRRVDDLAALHADLASSAHRS